jgi:hypothetical protein
MYLLTAAIDEFPAGKIRWTPNETGIYLPPPNPKPSPTLAEEVWLLVQEWYSTRGEIPAEEVDACLQAIQEETAELAKPAEPAEPAKPAKPSYGTPEFWKAYWAKKKGIKKG